MRGADIISTVLIVKVLVAIVYGVIMGIVMPIASQSLIKKRTEDPLEGTMLNKKGIKVTYILVGVAFSVLTAITAEDISLMIRNLVLLFPIFTIATVDLTIRKIPNPLLLMMIIVQVLYVLYACISQKSASVLISSGFGFFFGFLVCTIPSLLKIPVGAGDVKYSAVIGLCIYFMSYIQAMIFMSIFVLVLYAALKIKKKGDMKTMVPMGPFLSLGTVITMCFPLASQLIGNTF